MTKLKKKQNESPFRGYLQQFIKGEKEEAKKKNKEVSPILDIMEGFLNEEKK